MWTLGTSWNFFLRYAITVVTRENGSRRDPYPPTTVSLLTNPRSDFKSASRTRINHLNLPTRREDDDTQTHARYASSSASAESMTIGACCSGVSQERPNYPTARREDATGD